MPWADAIVISLLSEMMRDCSMVRGRGDFGVRGWWGLDHGIEDGSQ